MSLPKLNPTEPPWYGPVCPVVWEGRRREASPYPDQSDVAEKRQWFSELRANVRSEFQSDWKGDSPCDAVTFGDVDVCDLGETGNYDLVTSNVTIEHLLDPRAAFSSMFAALRTGGISVQFYHPFFCASGAHFDVLDFPWGHVRLSSEDIRRYIKEVRPSEVEIAEYRMFRTINRLTIGQVRKVVVEVGFELVDFVPILGNWREVTREIFQQAKTNYPSLALADLTAGGVWLVLKKP